MPLSAQTCLEIGKAMEVVWIKKLVERNAKIQANLSGATLLILRASEKFVHRHNLAVPRSSTGALAEKAKMCKVKLVKGIRQISPVASVEGVSMAVF